jgi:hypothetical protein
MKLLLSLLLLGCAGCRTASFVKPSMLVNIDNDAPPLVVKEGVTRVSEVTNSISLPPGRYRLYAISLTPKGNYYEAPVQLVSPAGQQFIYGGLFVPDTSESDQRQAAWFELEERRHNPACWLPPAVSRLFPFEEPVAFEEDSPAVE